MGAFEQARKARPAPNKIASTLGTLPIEPLINLYIDPLFAGLYPEALQYIHTEPCALKTAKTQLHKTQLHTPTEVSASCTKKYGTATVATFLAFLSMIVLGVMNTSTPS